MAKRKTISRKYMVMFGFEKSNDDHTGYLCFARTTNGTYGIYDIVDDDHDAARFPVENYDDITGFAYPVKWAEFFNSEAELSGWKFHPVPARSASN